MGRIFRSDPENARPNLARAEFDLSSYKQAEKKRMLKVIQIKFEICESKYSYRAEKKTR